MAPLDTPPDLAPEDVSALQDEVRELARERDAVILAHNYQRPEVQDVADYLGAYVEKTIGRALHVWDGECHVHAGIRPADIARTRAEHPGADFLIHPECGCSTSVMEYVAAGDVEADGVHMLSTGGMLTYAAEHAGQGGTAIMGTA